MSADQKPVDNIVCLRVRNSRASELMLRLEPWGEVYTMPPASVFEVRARGPSGDSLELEYGDAEVTVCGWTGSVVSIFLDKAEMGV